MRPRIHKKICSQLKRVLNSNFCFFLSLEFRRLYNDYMFFAYKAKNKKTYPHAYIFIISPKVVLANLNRLIVSNNCFFVS